MDSSEEWYATYKGNGVGDCERGGGWGGGGEGRRGLEGEDGGGPGKVRSDPLGLRPRPGR